LTAEVSAKENLEGSRLPLSAVRVLDLTDEAGVFGTRMLADLGADVLRLEPTDGDSVRRRVPYLLGEAGVDRSLAHLHYNGGKRSVALAFDRADAWDLVEPLLDWADIVVGPLHKSPNLRRFLNPLRVEARHPNLSQVELVFRRDDPEAPASDLAGVAAGGMLWLNGLPDDPPNYPAGKLAYKQTSIAAAFAAISLVTGRFRGGEARLVTISMQEAVTWTTIQTANQNVWEWSGAVQVAAEQVSRAALPSSRPTMAAGSPLSSLRPIGVPGPPGSAKCSATIPGRVTNGPTLTSEWVRPRR